MGKKIMAFILSLILCLEGNIPFTGSVKAATGDLNAHLVKVNENCYQIKSPQNRVEAEFFVDGSGMHYSVARDGSEKIKNSDMGVAVNEINYANTSIQSVDITEIERSYAHNGNQSTLTENCIQTIFKLKSGSVDFYLDFRIYDDGVAFRYRFPNLSGESTITDELTSFVLGGTVKTAWYGVNNRDYEAEITAHNPADASSDRIVAPITVEMGDGGYVAIQEGGMSDSYAGTNFRALGNNTYKIANTWNDSSSASYTVNKDITTAWRIVEIADNLNELVNNYIVYHVNEEMDADLYADTSWIEPGRSAWSWLTDYGACLQTPDAMYTYTENAARLGFEYNLIDDGYAKWDNYKDELKNLGIYGESMNVKQILWGQVTTNNAGYKMTNVSEAKAFLDDLSAFHLYGGKIDFWWGEDDTDRTNHNNTALQEEILKMAAERKLVIDFHGCNKPAGLDATYPNELSREAVRGLENIGASSNTNYTKQVNWLTRQLFTRYLSGHADWTPACNTTMQIASLICIDSPYNVIATDPTDILSNEALEFIKSIPTAWDQTKVLSSSKIGEKAIYAKESKGSWYLGGLMAVDGDVSINLSEFLPDDGTYYAEIWQDNGLNKKVKTVKEVTSGDVLNFNGMTVGTGFAARFSKMNFSEYGGEILYGNPLEIKTVSDNSVVKYTTDGTNPMSSATASVYKEPIQLTNTCKLKAAIVSGDGKGTMISHNFNKIGENSVYADVDYGKGVTNVTISVNTESDIYYTTDGTIPTLQRYLLGDFDYDGNNTTADISQLRSIIMSGEPTAEQLKIGNVSGADDALTVSDVVALRKNILNNKKIYLNLSGAIKYTGPIAVKNNCTLKVMSVPKDGGEASYHDYSIFVNSAEEIQPDVYLGGDYVEGKTDWGSIKIDKNLNGDTISLGGKAQYDGNGNLSVVGSKTYEHGFGMNAAGYLVYEVPKGATQFVGVIGIDDRVYDNTNDGAQASSTLTVSFDGKEVVTTPVFRMGDAYNVAVDVPKDAKQMKLYIGDGGNGITCDNVSMGNAGWVFGNLDEIVPDVFLKTDYISATTGWSDDPASVDRNTKRETISIAGIQYGHGISTNAIGEFVYNIPGNAKRFVGIVGVDDVVKKNANDGYKASITCTIYFDDSNQAAYTSLRLLPDQMQVVDVAVPSGAKTIRIVFGDAGDGITCDNASMGNAGWIFE